MTGHPDDRAVRYLLDELPPAERDAFEDEFVADRGLYQELLAAEDELIDRYCDDELSPEQRIRFERRYLATAEGRERVRFARTLIQAMEPHPDAKAAVPPAPLRRPASWLPWAAALAMAATALLLLARPGGGTRGAREEMEALRRDLAAQEARAREQDRRLAELKQEAEHARERTQALQELLGLDPGTPLRAALLVLAGTLEREDALPPRLVLAPEVQIVRLQMPLSGAPRGRYRASLQTAEGRELWSRQGLSATTDGGQATVRFTVPASVLSRGHYVVTLAREAAAPTGETDAEFVFEVRRAP